LWTEHDRPIAHVALNAWTKQLPASGPVVRHDKRMWTFTADDLKKSTRQIVELVAEGEPLPPDAVRSTSPLVDDWQRAAVGQSQWDMGRFARDWTLVQGRYNNY